MLVTDDAGIRELNQRWRGLDRATDILSFSQLEVPRGARVAAGMTERGRVVDFAALGKRPLLGDLVLSAESAARQAARFGHDLSWELERLLVHGILHLCGHDHVHGGRQARRMREEEERLRRMLGRARGRRRKQGPID
jgi:probable rRNA maturation factor